MPASNQNPTPLLLRSAEAWVWRWRWAATGRSASGGETPGGQETVLRWGGTWSWSAGQGPAHAGVGVARVEVGHWPVAEIGWWNAFGWNAVAIQCAIDTLSLRMTVL